MGARTGSRATTARWVTAINARRIVRSTQGGGRGRVARPLGHATKDPTGREKCAAFQPLGEYRHAAADAQRDGGRR